MRRRGEDAKGGVEKGELSGTAPSLLGERCVFAIVYRESVRKELAEVFDVREQAAVVPLPKATSVEPQAIRKRVPKLFAGCMSSSRGAGGVRSGFGCGVVKMGVREGVATESVTEASKVVVGGIGDRSAVVEPFMSALAPPPQGESPAKLLSVLLSVLLSGGR